MKTRAAVIYGVGEDWKITDVELDPPKAGEVLVRMRVAGVCHSDDHYRTGDLVPARAKLDALRAAGIEPPPTFPLIGGHEGAGVVVEVGPGVTELAVGDHVAASFVPACGRCRFCVTGRSTLCDVGAHLFSPAMVTDHTQRRWVDGAPVLAMMQLGTFAEQVVAAAASWIRIDPASAPAAASLVSCGVCTGFGAATKSAGTEPGDVVVVIGAGGIGMNAIQGARLAGAGTIVAVDPVPYKRERAPTFGATHTVESIRAAGKLVRQLTRGLMADRVIVAPGVLRGEMVSQALDLTRKGGCCVLVGLAPLTETSVPFSLANFVSWEKDLRGCLFGSLNPRSDVPRMLELYRTGGLKLDELATRTYSLDDVNEAISDMHEGETIRGLIHFDEEPAPR